MITTIDKKGDFTIVTNDCCKKCRYYNEECSQLINPYCITCTRIMILKIDRFAERVEE